MKPVRCSDGNFRCPTVLFAAEQREGAKQEDGTWPDGFDHKAFMSETAAKWKAVDEKTKERYSKLAATDKERYSKECREAGIETPEEKKEAKFFAKAAEAEVKREAKEAKAAQKAKETVRSVQPVRVRTHILLVP